MANSTCLAGTLPTDADLAALLARVRGCRLCEAHLPSGPRPVLTIAAQARILIIGQAPGTRVHATGIPWNDPSGDRLRSWMNIDRETFYDSHRIAIMPMGFCYPGKGKGGDLPPRPECAKTWHEPLHEHLPNIVLTLLVGSYAVNHYLKGFRAARLKDTVAAWRQAPRPYWPLPHPSPRNTRYLRDNPWFDSELVPQLQRKVHAVLKDDAASGTNA